MFADKAKDAFMEEIIMNLKKCLNTEDVFLFLSDLHEGIGSGCFVNFQADEFALSRFIMKDFSKDKIQALNNAIRTKFLNNGADKSKQFIVRPLKYRDELTGIIISCYAVKDKELKRQLDDLWRIYSPFLAILIDQYKKYIFAQEKIAKQKLLLAINEHKLMTTARLANLGLWEYDVKTETFEFNENFYYIYGTSVAREGRFMSFDKYVNEFVYPEDAWMLDGEKSYLSLKRNKGYCDAQHRIIRRDGKIRTILVRRIFWEGENDGNIKIYGTNQDISERIAMEKDKRRQAATIQNLAYIDSLTGLANRHSLGKYLAEDLKKVYIKEVYNKAYKGVLFFIDLDDLKMINNTYGHSYGDEIIRAVAKKISQISGKDAFVSRVSGDEFAVILKDVDDIKTIKLFARKLLSKISEKQTILRVDFHITASMGIVMYPKDGDTVDELLKNADNAMYAAKTSGKNKWQFYTVKMQQDAYKKIRLTNSLRYALDNKELYLVYQPQISTQQRKLIGFEALLRWNSSEYGTVSPAHFIPLAEQSDLIQEIGNWVLYKTCFFIKDLLNEGWHGIHIAVNISSRQIADENFVAMIGDAIESTGIRPENLEIEVTESLCMASLDDAQKKLSALRQMGVHLSMDDFGTGFSSLTYLRKLPFKSLKIDKSFIDIIETDVNGAKIIDSIIKMAHTMDMNVVAEGVETQGQLEYLTANKCDFIQGYIFSKPLSEYNAREMLNTRIYG